MTGQFTDLLAANAGHAAEFPLAGHDGVARAGVAVVTCMDPRVDPLSMLRLRAGDAAILRNPGARVTDHVLAGIVLAVHLLGVERVLVVAHTRCAVAGTDEETLRRRVAGVSGQDASRASLGAVPDQQATLRADVARVRTHPLVPEKVAVGGFRYDVDTGPLSQFV
ncbi:MAG: carbonic anhydrase [Actinomycetota bacterium]|nr:carbonic anhydrase [Actinomycetota bacterium]